MTAIQEHQPLGRRIRPGSDEAGSPLSVLLLEPEPSLVALVRDALATGPAAIELHEARALPEALGTLTADDTDCLLVALEGEPDAAGLRILTSARAACPVPVVMLVGPAASQATCLAAIRAGAQDCLSTDQLTAGRLEYTIRCAVERHAAGCGDAWHERMAAIVATSHDPIFSIDLDGGVATWNAGAEAFYGYTAEEMIDGRGTMIVPAGRLDEVDDIRRRIAAGETVGPFDTQRLAKDGSIREVSVTVSPIHDEHGVPVAASVVGRDIAPRKETERALVASEQRFRAVFDGAGDAMLIADDDGRFLEANPAACRLFGHERQRLLTLRVEDVGLPASGGHVPGSALTIRRPDGEPREIEYATTTEISPGRHLSVARDVTARNRDEGSRLEMEHRLNQAERMETVGQLAGGVAHDFNNVLSIIVNYTELARHESDLEAARADLAEIADAAARGRALTRQLLIVSRRDVATPEVFDLVELVESVQQLLKRVIGERIRIETHLPRGPVAVRADRGRIDQLIMNLALNARDAMPAGGTLSIGIERRRPDGPPGAVGDVELTVADNGVGMVEGVAARAFEPFYTTKASGQGVGLGLAAAYGIVGDAGGTISLRSKLGEGTVVEVLLPGTSEVPEAGGASSLDEEGLDGAGRRVLIVEDDPQLLAVTRRVLERHGYVTTTAANGEAALAQIDKARVDVVLTDLVMPGMSGVAMAQSIRARRPDIAVVCMSGYSPRRGMLPDDVEILEKPFTPVELLAIMARAGVRG